MSKQSRRDFLKVSAATGGALALAPAGVSISAQESAAPPAMAIARCTGSPTDAEAIRKMAVDLTTGAIEALGGMKRFMQPGAVVFIKPNMAWDRTPELAANTNPDLVATLVTLCKQAGAKQVKVGDFTCHDAKLAYASSGIADAAKAAGADIVFVDGKRFRDYDLQGKILKQWPVYPDFVEADLLINAAIVKHHSISTLTACMKNYMGIANNRNRWHQNLPACLCDITRFMKPQLSVLDAIRILTASGPTGGNPDDVKRMDLVAAGTDIVALDALGAELLGHKPEDIATVAAGQAEGLGTMDYRSLSPKEVTIA